MYDPIAEHCFPVSPSMRLRNLLPSNGRCSQSHYLATGLHAAIYRVIQEELPPLTELISDILRKKCHINLGHIFNIYRVTFVFGFFSKFQFNVNYKLHHLNAFIVTKTN
jgi:hypothetical protein